MSGIYIHIPFCKKRCYYCNFYFSTNFLNKEDMILALCKELELSKKKKIIKKPIKTIYFGGGTPSLLNYHEINKILKAIYKNYLISKKIEITIEINPDDLSTKKLKDFYSLGIRRLSIGVQSFFKKDLYFMNRTHSKINSINLIKKAQNLGFLNISIDLIYGSFTTTDKMWSKNLDIFLETSIPHISSYALTVEPKTILFKKIYSKEYPPINEKNQVRQYKFLVERLENSGFIHYEISNFGKNSYFSKHNINYWRGYPYLGIGPSSHSFDGFKKRYCNISNNKLYIESIQKGIIPCQEEYLSITDRYNEYLLTGLRTFWGVDMFKIKKKFGKIYYDYLSKESKNFIYKGILELKETNLFLSKKYWIYADSVISDLFFV